MSGNRLGRRGVLYMVVLIVAMSFVSWAMMVRLQLQNLEDEIAAKETRFAMMELQNQLQIPSEVLYFDPKLSMELAALRMRSYTNHGATSILPYANLMSPSIRVHLHGKHELPLEPDRESFVQTLANTSPENYWLNFVRHPLFDLAGEINDDERLGGYFKQHPEEFDQHVRPLIVRMLDAYHPWIACYGVEVLLAMEDRSDQLMEIVSIMLRLESADEQVQRMVEQYSLNVKEAESMTLNEDSKKVLNPEWERVHALVSELKVKYPVVEGTIIDDWHE